MLKRLDLFCEITVPAIKSQVDKNFVVCLIVNPNHEKVIRERSGLEFEAFYSLSEYNEMIKKNGVMLQSRMDCDDSIDPEYIADVKKRVLHALNKREDLEGIAVHYQVLKYDPQTGKIWKRERNYHSQLTSMFLTIWQKEDPKGIYEYAHNEWWRHVNEVVTVEHGFARWTMHPEQHHKRPDRGDYSINNKCEAEIRTWFRNL